MTDSTYHVVFAGQALPGHDRDTAICNLARLLKRTPEQVAAAFSGKTSVLKKGLSKADADKYCLALEKAGLLVHAEAEVAATLPPASAASSLSLVAQDDEPMAASEAKVPVAAVAPPKISASLALVEDDEPHADPAVTASAQPGAGMTCPACGREQPKADICVGCHVVIAKFLPRKVSAATKAVTNSEPKTSLLGKLFGKPKGE